MDIETLFYIALGWFMKKLKDFGSAVVRFIWFLIWAKSEVRCMVALVSFTAFLKMATVLRNVGVLRGYSLRKVTQFVEWANPRLDAWQARVRPPSKPDSINPPTLLPS
jgi:hypothetical protein